MSRPYLVSRKQFNCSISKNVVARTIETVSLQVLRFVPSVGPVQSCWFLSPSAGASAVDLSAAAKHHRRVFTNHRFLDSSHDFFSPDVNHRSEALVAE
ncbi:hypothetical protein AVEN_185962-1 [Araneus ventricosus]|uniref:Uncharacterized protein n=1 Tax=Araneus ventricosus TaxID=182803 RepID=A0A4Y2LDW0_ARAVE|nr:hypothetical protein AVEN_185962-1 [Araneus ventricosus]